MDDTPNIAVKRSNALKKLIFLALISLSFPSVAERWFEVEVIVFKRNLLPNSIEEKWPDTQPEIDMENAISLLSPTSRKKYGLSLLPKNKRQLTDEYNRLRKHAGYTPLLHLAWRQNDGNRRQMPKIRFRAGKNYQADFYSDGTPLNAQITLDDFTETSLTDPTKTPKINKPIYELDGFIRLYVQHYLFIETDLVLRQPGERNVLQEIKTIQIDSPYFKEESTFILRDPPSFEENIIQPDKDFENPEQTYAIERYLRPYPFKHKRRMKSGETHYLDHPMLGLIIQVRRIN